MQNGFNCNHLLVLCTNTVYKKLVYVRCVSLISWLSEGGLCEQCTAVSDTGCPLSRIVVDIWQVTQWFWPGSWHRISCDPRYTATGVQWSVSVGISFSSSLLHEKNCCFWWCMNAFLSLFVYVQVYISWFPVHTVMAALHLLRWGDNHGKYRPTTCSCTFTH